MSTDDSDDPYQWARVDPNVAALENVDASLRDLAVLGQAEATVALARHRDLARQHRTAVDQLRTAHRALDTARARGDQKHIDTAQALYDQRRSEFENIDATALPQMQAIMRSRLDHIQELLEGAARYADAYRATTTIDLDHESPEAVTFRAEFATKIVAIEALLIGASDDKD